ncbi:NAD(P)/FAD-dependent oxidoreductase [Streptomyces sp. NPDC001156]
MSTSVDETMNRIVVVGAGLAGGRTCEQLRRQGFTGEIVLLGSEPHAPYDRPPLSKDVLHGRRDDTALSVDLRGLDIDSRFGSNATSLDVPGRCLITDHGPLSFDGLVIATGAHSIRLPGSGPQFTLRTIDDARAIRSRLVPGSAVIIIGASWIGAEVATAALARGCSVICLEAAQAPLAASLGEQVGAELAPLWNRVDLRTGCRVREVVADGVELTDGTVLHGDLVVTGVGVKPATEWLAGSLPRADGAVIVDEHLEATAGIVALGDAAARWSPRYQRRLRVEHWDNAATAARTAAAAVLDRTIRSEPPRLSFDPVPYFWSDQFGCKLQFAGVASGSDSVVWRGDHGTRSRSAAWVDGTGRMTALLTINAPAEMAAGRRALAADGVVHAGRLSDPTVPLADRDHSPTSSALGVSALPFDPGDDRS